jgi:hypothetical protein
MSMPASVELAFVICNDRQSQNAQVDEDHKNEKQKIEKTQSHFKA